MSKLKSKGKFTTSISDAAAILKELELYRGENLFWRNASEEFLKVSKQDNYKKMYDTAIEHYDYNLILKEGSIFQFEEAENENLRFAFLQAPYNYVSFENFLLTFMDEQDMPNDKMELIGLKISFENDYEQFLSEQGVNSKVIYFRYDIDSEQYDPNVHSYAHLHVGLCNDIRIPCASRLTPASFVVFVIKQVYKKYWEKYVLDNNRRSHILHLAKDRILLEDDKWNEEEKKELFLF